MKKPLTVRKKELSMLLSLLFILDDDVVAFFNDADKGKVIYEYKGNFYVSTGNIPAEKMFLLIKN